MWLWKLFLVALEYLFYIVTVSEAWGLCTCKLCYHCTGCSATSCKGRNRSLSLLDYLDRYDQEVNRQLQVTSPVIPCSIANTMCGGSHNKYCCALQPDGRLSCGLGEGWSTCVAGSALINNIITPIYTKSQCDFDFPCTGNGGNDCCGGLDLYNGEGAGTCSTTYCTSSDLQLVACNYVGTSALVYKTPDFDATILVNGLIPTQSNNDYCGNGNRNSGRCRASNLCCSPLGLCSKVDSCTTKSISWAWYGGSINNWIQTGGAADSSIPCGGGVIGHGRCPTAADGSDYGIRCCSDSGMCDSSYCNGASGNDYACSCSHGTAGRGTRGCKTCASCNDGYYLSSSNGNTCSPVKLDSFNCPLGSFVISINLWYDSGSKFITGIDSFTCSTSSSTVNVNKGQKTGAQRSSTETSGYCGGKVGYVYRPLDTKNQFTTELTVSSCDSVSSTTYGGPISNEPTNFSIAYGFQGGKQLTGIQAATCENAGSNNVCFLNFIFTTVQTPSPTQSTVPTAAPTPSPTSKPTAVPSSAPTASLTTLKPSTAVPTTPKPSKVAPTTAPTGTCSCKHGVGGVGVAGCSTCKRCSSGYALHPDTYLCVPTTVVNCPTATFITQLRMKYWSTSTIWVDGITSMKCSDGSTVPVNAGGTTTDDISFTATAGDGSSSSPGYCASSEVYDYSGASQLKLTECTGGIDGPFGTYSSNPTPISVTKTCGVGQKGVGVETTTTNPGNVHLSYFSIVCGPIP